MKYLNESESLSEKPINIRARKMNEDACRLLDSYRLKPDEETRNKITNIYIPYVKYLAKMMHDKLPSNTDVNDLESMGYFGVFDAIQNYDPSKKVKFTTFASRHINGRMMDYLRQNDIPRISRARKKQIEKIKDDFFKSSGRFPSDEEISIKIKSNGDKPELVMKNLFTPEIKWVSPNYSIKLNYKEYELKNKDFIDYHNSPDTFDPTKPTKERLTLDNLSYGLEITDRHIINLHYYKGLTMKETGLKLGLSESRISQRLSIIEDIWKTRARRGELEIEDLVA